MQEAPSPSFLRRALRTTFLILAAGLIVAGVGIFLRLRAFGIRDGADQMGLRVVHQGRDFDISWDRSSRAVAMAKHGRLLIEDGNAVSSVDLDAGTLRQGHVIYTPIRADLNVRLEVETRDQRTQTASVVILGGPHYTPKSPVVSEVSETRAAIQAPVVRPLNSNDDEEDNVRSRSIPTRAYEESEEPERRRFRAPSRAAPAPISTPVLAAPEVASISAGHMDALKLGTLPALKPPPPPAASQASQPPQFIEPVALQRSRIQVPAMVRAALSGRVSVIVKVIINRNGLVGSVKSVAVEGNAGPYIGDLRQAAVAAAKGFVFRPGTLNGTPIDTEQTIQFIVAQ